MVREGKGRVGEESKERKGKERVGKGDERNSVTRAYLRISWEDNIKVDFRDVGCDDIDGIILAEDRAQRRLL
jgi:hypothetical protein